MKGILFGFILLVLFPAIKLEAQPDISGHEESKVRIGVYDSRVVAYAYTFTDEFTNEVNRLNALRDSAFNQGDRALVIGIERTINGIKGIYYRRIYSTYPVEDILGTVSDKVAEIAVNANLSTIVSKWGNVYLGKDVELVDITKELASIFADSTSVAILYPPEGIPDPKTLIEAEGLSDETGFLQEYGMGPQCSVEKKFFKSEEMRPRISGIWRATAVFVNGQMKTGMFSWYFHFNENGIIEVEENKKYFTDGEWIIGLNENALILKLTDEKKSLTGRYDFNNDYLIISGKGYIDPLDHVCIILRRIEQ